MKNILTLVTCILTTFNLFSNVNFSIDYSFFQTEKSQAYVEFYLSVQGNSISYGHLSEESDTNLYQAKIEMTYLIEQGEKVIAFEKFQINSPKYSAEEAESNPFDLLDLKRMRFGPGNYTYTIVAKDLIDNSISEAKGTLQNFVTKTNEILLSDIQVGNKISPTETTSQFSKAGYEISPSVTHNFVRDNNQISVYFEIYNANKALGDSTAYLLDVSIIDAINEDPSGNLRTVKRLKAISITPRIQSFNLKDLPTGSYEVLVKLINRQNELISSKKVSFFRLNPELNKLDDLSIQGTFVDSMKNIDLITEYIKSIRVISLEREKIWADNQLKYAELEFMQRYFLNFWRNRNALEPGKAWEDYKQKLAFVDEQFGYGGVSGYNTDRGRVYLQYGAPTDLQNVKYDSDNHPYSIWRYYKLTDCYRKELNGLTDRKFIFFSNTNEMLGYEVLHSNVPGEQQNEQWEYALSKKAITKRPGTREDTHLNGQERARDLFDNPR